MGAVTMPHRDPAERVSGRYAVPRRRATVVPRERLLRRLHGNIGSGLTIVQAPAGFGKSTLLALFAQDIQDQYAVRWLSLDSASAVPEVFARQVAAALLGDEAAQAPSTVARPGDIEAYLGAMLRLSAETSDLPLLLILDNLHVMRDDSAAGALVGWLIENLPAGAELILSGRELPECPPLDEVVATGTCLYLAAADLAFDESEAGAAIAASGATWEPIDLTAATDGWPVGVMSLLAGLDHDGSVRQRRSRDAFERYLASEVWETVPAELRGALMQVAIPDVIGPELGRQVAGELGWLELSRWLGAREFLCEPLPEDAIRLNPLLREFLEAKFRSTAPRAYASATRRYIESALRAGHVTEAVETARAAGHHHWLATLIEEHGSRLILQGAFASLWRAIETLPEATLKDRPTVFAIRARVLAHRNFADQALADANLILADSSAPGESRVHALLARLRALRLLGRPEQLVADAEGLRAVEAGAGPVLAAELSFHLAEIELSVTRDLGRAERLLRETIARCEAGGIQPLDVLARSTLGQLLTMRGDAPGAVSVLASAAVGWRRLGRSSNLGWVLNNLGMAHLQTGDFESAVDVLEEARREGIRCGNPRNTAYAIASLAEAEHALGNYDNARHQYEEAIRICAEDSPDETLAALSIAGLSAALLALGDISQADFFSRRALLVAVSAATSYEVAFCKLQQGAVDSAGGNHVVAIANCEESIELFARMDTQSSLIVANYRLAMCYFRAGRRAEAQDALAAVDRLISEPWRARSLLPLVREHPMFAQWAASRNLAGVAFRELIERHPFAASAPDAAEKPAGRFPTVVAKSLGQLSVSVGGRLVTDEAWSSVRAKELFFLFLSNRGGLRKEEAVELLYPELSPEKCNSAFHSNLYRVRKALYQESVVKQDGTYVLNPEGEFDWDVDEFEAALNRAERLPKGSKDRARAYEAALEQYRGPFAEAFFSEWAGTVRVRAREQADEALTTLAGYYAGREDYEAAAHCMERVLAADRLNEEAAYQFAEYRALGGQRAAALAFLDDYRRAYEEELGQLPQRFGQLRSRLAAGAG